MQSGLEKVNHTLENKIILCTGNAYQRKKMLFETYQNDIQFFPFKKIFFSTNDPENMDVVFGEKVPVRQLLPKITKQIDCLNCLLSTIKNAVLDPEVLDEDILLFKHESYYVKDLHLVRKALGTIVLNGYDLVIHQLLCASPWYHPGSFFMKVSSARPLFRNISLVKQFAPYEFFEYYLTKNILNAVAKIYKVGCAYEAQDTRMGFHHIKPDAVEYLLWDKKDYDQLFKDVNL